jgi:hypothetical protein
MVWTSMATHSKNLTFGSFKKNSCARISLMTIITSIPTRRTIYHWPSLEWMNTKLHIKRNLKTRRLGRQNSVLTYWIKKRITTCIPKNHPNQRSMNLMFHIAFQNKILMKCLLIKFTDLKMTVRLILSKKWKEWRLFQTRSSLKQFSLAVMIWLQKSTHSGKKS